MISIYNKAIVRELNPELLDRLEKIEKEKRSSRLETAKNGEDCLVVQSHDREYYITSRYHPSHEAEKLIGSYHERTGLGKIIFFGVGLGYHIKEGLKRFPDVKYFLIEPDLEILYRFLEKNELKDLSIKNLCGIEADYEQMSMSLPVFSQKFEGTIETIPLKGYISIFPERYEKYLKEYVLSFKKEKDEVIATVALEDRRIKSFIFNMRTILSVPNLFWIDKQQFKDQTAILVAAGPSLEEEIENLKQIKKDKMAGIFAVGSAVNALIANGIYPDAVFSYDPTAANQKVLQEIKNQKITEIPLFFGMDIGYESLADYPGEIRSIVIRNSDISNYFFADQKEPLPDVYAGPTVSVLALNCLFALGFSTITFVGQNLGMRDGQHYSRGISYIPAQKNDPGQYSEKTLDVYGNEIVTASVYLIMKDSLEKSIKQFGGETKIFNSTKGGAAIKGTHFKELSELMKTMSKNGFVMDLTSRSLNYDVAHLEKKEKKLAMERDVIGKYIVNYDNILLEIRKQTELRQYERLQKSYVKLNLALKRLETNLFSYMFVLPMLKLEYNRLVSKIEFFNEISDLHEKAIQIENAFCFFIEQYKEEFDSIKVDYTEMEAALKDYIAKKKAGRE